MVAERMGTPWGETGSERRSTALVVRTTNVALVASAALFILGAILLMQGTAVGVAWGVLGAFTGVLLLALAAIPTGWMLRFLLAHRRKQPSRDDPWVCQWEELMHRPAQ